MSKKTGIACEEGEYKDFSGIIFWGDNEGVVENATFDLEEWIFSKAIVFKKGIWENGVLEYGTWEDGTWKNGIWESGAWNGGIWKNGIWENGAWGGGIWENGAWGGGIWKGGTWKDGVWENGIWVAGVWENGIWKTGYDKNECTRIVSPNNWKNLKQRVRVYEQQLKLLSLLIVILLFVGYILEKCIFLRITGQ